MSAEPLDQAEGTTMSKPLVFRCMPCGADYRPDPQWPHRFAEIELGVIGWRLMALQRSNAGGGYVLHCPKCAGAAAPKAEAA